MRRSLWLVFAFTGLVTQAEAKRAPDEWDPYGAEGREPFSWDGSGGNMQDWNFQENGTLAVRHQGNYNGTWYMIRTLQGFSSGQVKFQFNFADVSGNVMAGVVGNGCGLGHSQHQTNANPSFALHGGSIYRYNSALASDKPNIVSGSIVQVALDFDRDQIEFWHNGTSLGTYSGITGQTFHPAISCTHYQIKIKVGRAQERKQGAYLSREPAGFSTQDRRSALLRLIYQSSNASSDRPLNILLLGRVGRCASRALVA